VSAASQPAVQRPRRSAAQRPGVAARAVATALYSSVLDRSQPFDRLIDPVSGDTAYRALAPRDRRLVHAIVATALRRKGEIEAVLNRLIEKKPPKRSGPLARILEIAATQILFLDLPDHAVVSVALEQLIADRDARHFKGLANAVLRRLARDKETVRAGLDAARLDTPNWLWQRWLESYGEATTRRIAEMHLVEPSLDLTVKSAPELWAERLGGIVLPTGSVRLVPSGPIEALAGYAEGEWWVQDAAAALPAQLLGPLAGKRVADLCAAPGGKTAQIALAGAHVTAVDTSATRLRRLRDNLSRLRLEAETIAADLLQWNPAEPFDAVLLDAPCSSTGTIRRHPDIARLKRPGDISGLSALQEQMLDRAVTLLKPGGILLYCTCSLEPEEGEIQYERAIARHGLKPLPVEPREIGNAIEVITPRGTIRTLPSHLAAGDVRLAGLDGFFVGRCQKA
jgi:16S rRNA (cytosine967-C5)-methyltransferase